MSFKLKTLIVFDTNSLRSTEAGEVAYSFFAFGRPFQAVENFLLESNLDEDIHIAIPTWAIEELKDQKQLQYQNDIAEFQKLAKRLSGMPHINKISLPEDNFDCITYINEKVEKFITAKDLKLIDIPEVLANTVLQNMMKRVMKEERVKHPFVHAKRGNKTYKDAGFKDNLIWESLLHYPELKNYDKVIFITADSDYSNCKEEFVAKWNKHFSILSDENNVIAEITKDYSNYISERVIFDFAQTEYFREYLFDDLKVKSTITIEGAEYKIQNFRITELCRYVDRWSPNEEGVENILISTTIEIDFTQNSKKKVQRVEGLTLLWDDESKEIISTEYDIELR